MHWPVETERCWARFMGGSGRRQPPVVVPSPLASPAANQHTRKNGQDRLRPEKQTEKRTGSLTGSEGFAGTDTLVSKKESRDGLAGNGGRQWDSGHLLHLPQLLTTFPSFCFFLGGGTSSVPIMSFWNVSE